MCKSGLFWRNGSYAPGLPRKETYSIGVSSTNIIQLNFNSSE